MINVLLVLMTFFLCMIGTVLLGFFLLFDKGARQKKKKVDAELINQSSGY